MRRKTRQSRSRRSPPLRKRRHENRGRSGLRSGDDDERTGDRAAPAATDADPHASSAATNAPPFAATGASDASGIGDRSERALRDRSGAAPRTIERSRRATSRIGPGGGDRDSASDRIFDDG